MIIDVKHPLQSRAENKLTSEARGYMYITFGISNQGHKANITLNFIH